MDLAILIDAFKPFAKLLLILTALVFIGIILDYLTGTIAAKKLHEWSSKIAREGIWHKVGIIIAVLLAAMLDIVVIVATKSVLKLSITYFGLFAPLVALSYTLTEFGSIIENLKKMGVYVPAFLTRGFASIKNAVDAHADAVVPKDTTETAAPIEEEYTAKEDEISLECFEPPDEEECGE